MPNMNMAVLAGHLGKDATQKYTANGTSITTFSMATSSKRGEEEQTQWHNIVMFGHADMATKLLKGVAVTVTGRIQYRTYDDKDGNKRYVTEIVSDSVFVHERREGGPSAAPRPKPAAAEEDPNVPF
jgi:single-strand DNA-binding protein